MSDLTDSPAAKSEPIPGSVWVIKNQRIIVQIPTVKPTVTSLKHTHTYIYLVWVVYLCVCLLTYTFERKGRLSVVVRGAGFSEAGVTGIWELFHVGARN